MPWIRASRRRAVASLLLSAGLISCGTNGPSDPLATALPKITLGSVGLVGVEIINTGGPGVYLLWPVQLTGAGTLKSPSDCYSTDSAGQIASGSRKTVAWAYQCSGGQPADLLVLYGGLGATSKDVQPVGCYALGSKLCPALAGLDFP